MPIDADALSRGTETFNEVNPTAYSAMKNALSEISPDLMQFASAFPFGELYVRGTISKRDRQLITVVALAMPRPSCVFTSTLR